MYSWNRNKAERLFYFSNSGFRNYPCPWKRGIWSWGGIQSASSLFMWNELFSSIPVGSRQEAIKVVKSYLAWRPWTISFLWRAPFKLHSFLPCGSSQLKIWRSNQDGDNNRWILGSSFSVQKHFCLSWIFCIFETRWIINTFWVGSWNS